MSSQGIIHPQAKWLPKWMMMVVALLLYNTAFIPFRVCFTFDYAGTAWEFIDWTVDAFFWADMLLHFRLGYYRRALTRNQQAQVLVLDPTRCAMRYLRSWFVLDFVSVFPFDAVIEAGLSASSTYQDGSADSTTRLTRLVRLTRLPRLLRLFRFLRARRLLTSWAKPGKVPPAFWRLMSLVMWLTILVHVVACVLHLIHEIEESFSSDETWITELVDAQKITNTTVDKYLTALYWSVMTMTTVGYGDVPMATTAEKCFPIFCMMLGALVFAYLLGLTQHLLVNLDQSSSEIQQRKEAIGAWMRYRNLSPDLQDRVRSYFSFLWSRQQVFDEAANLELLPLHLRKEVALETNSRIVTKIPFFQHADKAFISELVLGLRPVYAAAGDWLIRAGEIGAEMFIVDSGAVDIVSPNGKEVYRTLGVGEFFGEIALLTKAKRSASCLALTFSELWSLARNDLLDVFVDYPEVRSVQALACPCLSAHPTRALPVESAVM